MIIKSRNSQYSQDNYAFIKYYLKVSTNSVASTLLIKDVLDTDKCVSSVSVSMSVLHSKQIISQELILKSVTTTKSLILYI